MSKPVECLIYSRVSTGQQAEDGVSLETQLVECRRYAARQGFVLGREYQDIMSGTRDDRRQYQEMLSEVRNLARQGKRVAVVVWRLDRLGRKFKERVVSREELKQLGATTHSATEGGEVPDLVANILASVAEEEARTLGERVKGARRLFRERG